MPHRLRASLAQALAALPAPSARTLDAETLQRLRTCAALHSALARARSAGDADVARVVVATYSYLVATLAAAAQTLDDAIAYWERIAQETWRAGVFWLQSTCAH